MKTRLLLSLFVLAGCSPITNYQTIVKTPAPQSLEGVWRTSGPQSGLVSKDAVGYLIIDQAGNTLDCRQWQRVIAKPGKLSRINDQWVNVNHQVRIMPLKRKDGMLHYDRLTLIKVSSASEECQKALAEAKAQPQAETIQNIEINGQ
ncbi:YedD-like protein [Rosenbergiella nectarea]|uniref:YedD-like protein n=1 Tax=Rosenbergiella nectarea TaxID=988801 RepID=A0A1H9HVD6_9GAMM|nr:lipoprotein YedD [Rosenbergiella nectarea]SEQ66333.1 YedD-like protein [Rosenbergiella nectarea]